MNTKSPPASTPPKQGSKLAFPVFGFFFFFNINILLINEAEAKIHTNTTE